VGPAALNHDSPTWFKQAIINPGSVFANPEDVMSSPDLELDEKIRVLRSWQYDVAELAVAEEEGMRGSQNGMLRRILLLLSELNDGDAIESVAPTKHHGMMNS
jgi:hypothetical protein